MKSDLSNDARFVELPKWIQDGLKDIPVTGVMGEDDWHEVGFHMSNPAMICQCAIVNRRWSALPQSEIDRFDSLIYVFQDNSKQMINLAKPEG